MRKSRDTAATGKRDSNQPAQPTQPPSSPPIPLLLKYAPAGAAFAVESPLGHDHMGGGDAPDTRLLQRKQSLSLRRELNLKTAQPFAQQLDSAAMDLSSWSRAQLESEVHVLRLALNKRNQRVMAEIVSLRDVLSHQARYPHAPQLRFSIAAQSTRMQTHPVGGWAPPHLGPLRLITTIMDLSRAQYRPQARMSISSRSIRRHPPRTETSEAFCTARVCGPQGEAQQEPSPCCCNSRCSCGSGPQ